MPAKIILEGVTRRFDTGKASLEVLGGVSLSVADGEFVAIVGPSGAGKSTLMKIVSGFDRPSEGRVLVDGQALAAPSPKGIVISQHGSVFPWLTVRENLMFGLSAMAPEERAATADHYAALVGLAGFEDSYPRELSGGMVKRVEIARALAVKPEILYMDEPFSALDALMNLRMRNELLRILAVERHTVLLITHDVEEALYLADRVLVLSPRPATIQATFEIREPHPRKLSSPVLQGLKDTILAELGVVDDEAGQLKASAG
jgi:ABC-type nitrate/sulfonate/bicarbonate transport system ATPase subunit